MQSSAPRHFLRRAFTCSCSTKPTRIHGAILFNSTHNSLVGRSQIQVNQRIDTSRPFTTSPLLQRKKKKEIAEQEEDPKNAIPPEKVVDEAFDFRDLDDGFARNIDKLKEGLSKLRPGGRLDPEVIENFRVTFSGRNGTERLGDLATVIRKGGRTISVIVAEEENLRAVTNTIGTSQHSLNPIPDPESALTLNVDIPPPTTESRNAVKHAAKELMETANHAIRQVRGDYQKKLRKLELDKKTRVPKDEMVRAHKEMEKKNEAAVKEVKRIYEERIKALDR